HYGPELDCDLCHHIHDESENFCNECHSYEFVIP
ncbi:MAG: cytochrome c3 family protein, partial [Desulfobacteraceae bacterium]